MVNSKKVPGSRISALVALQLFSSSLVIGSGSEARQDSWLALVFALAASLPLLWLYAAVLRLFPGKGFFDIALETFGRVGGKIFIALYFFYAVFMGAMVIRIADDFIQLVNLPQSPQVALLLFSAPLVALQIRFGGLKDLSSCAKFLLPIVLIFVGSMFALGLRFMDVGNIQPVFGSGAKNLSQGTFRMMSVPLGDAVLSLAFFGEVSPTEKPFRILAGGILLGGNMLVLGLLRNQLILGAPVCDNYIYASYDAVGVINVGEFITRISVLIGVNLILASMARIGTCVYTATLGISQILGLKESRRLAAPCTLLMAAASFTLYDNLLAGTEAIQCLPLFGVPFQFLLPLLLLVCGKIRKSRRRRASPAPSAAPPSFSEKEREGADFFRTV